MIKDCIAKLVIRENLTHEQMTVSMEEIMEGKSTNAQIAGFLTALRMKGETAIEITAATAVMREKATLINVPHGIEAIDMVGTGGDSSNTFNISTASALVLAAGGVTVAKHGNSNVSSLCGSADVLKELGVNINASKETVELCIKEAKIGFLFAPNMHKAMKYASAPRKELGIRTIFNLIGPLTNPARVNRYIVGVFDKDLLETIAKALQNLSTKRAMVVQGEDGLDEITTTSKTKVFEINEKKIKDYFIDPKDFGIAYAKKEELVGGSPLVNANIIKDVLSGKKDAKRDIVALNAGAGFYIAGMDSSISSGVQRAYNIIDQEKANKTLSLLIKVSNND